MSFDIEAMDRLFKLGVSSEEVVKVTNSFTGDVNEIEEDIDKINKIIENYKKNSFVVMS
jgi:transcription initiation factor IIE alpha subunit